MVGGDQHEHIGSVRWRNPATNATGEATRATMVKWINEGGVAKVQGTSGAPDATIGVVNGTPPYIRTYADSRWTNNLLSLPRY